MPTRTIANKNIEFDAEGFMTDSTQWDLEVAKVLAQEEGVANLTDQHLLVVNFMRKEFQEKGTGPSVRRLTQQSGVDTKTLYALFPGGPAKKAAKIAGIKKPQGCV